MQWFRAICLAALVCGAALRASAEELRDPFVFGSRGPETEQSHQPILIGILWDARKPLAMIGEETFEIGETIAGWTVMEIHQDGVTLQRADRSVTLTPGSALPAD